MRSKGCFVTVSLPISDAICRQAAKYAPVVKYSLSSSCSLLVTKTEDKALSKKVKKIFQKSVDKQMRKA